MVQVFAQRPTPPEDAGDQHPVDGPTRGILFKQIATVRISDTFEKPEMATDLFEHDLKKLNILRQRGSESFANHEAALKELLDVSNTPRPPDGGK